MAKIRKVALGGMPDEPGDMGGGNFYDGPVPPPGLYSGNMKRLQLKTNKNGDYMVNGLIEVAEKSGPKAKFNGYGIWFNQNVTEQGAPYLANFLKGIGSTYKAFIADGGLQVDDAEPPNIIKIGTKRITDDIKVSVVTKTDIYNGQEKLAVTSFVVPKDDDDDDDAVEELEEPEEDEADEEAEDEDEAEEAGDGYTKAELMAMTIGDLRNLLKEQEWTAADWKGMSKADLVAELAPAEDDEPPF